MNTHYVTNTTKGDFMKIQVPKIKYVIYEYVYNNIKEYILVSILFVIGIFIGVMVLNNCNDGQTEEISAYITDFISNFKDAEINKTELIISSIKNNIILAAIIWLAGTTVIGVPVVLAVILFRGGCLGYTISAISYTLGTGKGILFSIISLLAQNLLFIPALLSLGVSSLKLYKSIIKDKRKENIKIEIVRHTIFSGLMLIILIASSFIENIVSITILQNSIKFF
jgi:stage II sporulation protein M